MGNIFLSPLCEQALGGGKEGNKEGNNKGNKEGSSEKKAKRSEEEKEEKEKESKKVEVEEDLDLGNMKLDKRTLDAKYEAPKKGQKVRRMNV
jgi:hypothetical protein